MGLFGRLVSLGGLLNGSKTLLGILSMGYVGTAHFAPEVLPVVDQVLQLVGVSLLPIGLAHKVVKAKDEVTR